MVTVEADVPLMDEGEKLTVNPLNAVFDSATMLTNPLAGVMLSLRLPLLPALMLRAVSVVASWKLAGAAAAFHALASAFAFTEPRPVARS